MSPARATIGWNMLVKDIGQEVSAINIIPKYLVWKHLKVLKGLTNMWCRWILTALEARGAIKAISAS